MIKEEFVLDSYYIDSLFDCIDGEQSKRVEQYQPEYEPDWNQIELDEREEGRLERLYKRYRQLYRARCNRYTRKRHERSSGKDEQPRQKRKAATKSLYPPEWTEGLKLTIRTRDGFKCMKCWNREDERAFHVHHIDYSKTNCSPDNLITLCPSCHVKTNHNRQRWIKYFERFDLC